MGTHTQTRACLLSGWLPFLLCWVLHLRFYVAQDDVVIFHHRMPSILLLLCHIIAKMIVGECLAPTLRHNFLTHDAPRTNTCACVLYFTGARAKGPRNTRRRTRRDPACAGRQARHLYEESQEGLAGSGRLGAHHTAPQGRTSP